MAPKQPNLKLPKSILDQIGDGLQGSSNGRGRRNGRPQTRKELRKAGRAEKKTLRNGPPPAKRQRVTNVYDGESDEESEEDEVVPITPPLREAPPREKVSKAARNELDEPKSILKKTKKSDPKPEEDRGRSITPPPRMSKSVRNKLAEDDEEIAALERKLGLKGKKNLPQSFKDDGLDELLDGLGGFEGESGEGDNKKQKSEADEWLQQKRRKAGMVGQEEAESEEDIEGSDTSQMSLDEGGDSQELDSDKDSDLNMADNDDFTGFGSEFDGEEAVSAAPRVRENPYVAPVPVEASSKYIPPSLRKPASSDSEALVRLRRQTQGLVNKLTETNLVSILGEIERLYRENPRQHVTSTLVDLLLISVCEPTSLPDSLIILPAGFIAAVYKIIGTDFGAQLIQRITELFEEHYGKATANAKDGLAAASTDSSKETSNLIMLLAELYIFQVVGSNLLYDYIRLFLDHLSELNAELLLRVVRAAGPQLRQDDPSSLKDIVALIRPAVLKAGGEQNISVRTKFMIETMDDLKNNKMRAGGQASAVTSEHTVRMKKILGSLNTRTIKGSEPLRISLDDIRNSDKKGKWWLVGASWAGNDDIAKDDHPAEEVKSKKRAATESAGTSDLFMLAKQHRMNTDIRRAIFVAIMSAEDYTDAYQRLTKLKLKKVQEYEIPKVLLHCAGAEKTYNPYYTLISQKVCSDRKLRTSFQFSLWDLFKKLGEGDEGHDTDDEDGYESLNMRQIVNLAKLFGTLIADNVMGVEVFKNLNFNILQAKTKTFLEVLFVTALVGGQKARKGERDEQAIARMLAKAKDNPSLARGLRYFFKKTVSKSDIVGSKHDASVVKWGSKVALDMLDRFNSEGSGEA